MEQTIENAEFWLPPEFLTDDDDIFKENSNHKTMVKDGCGEYVLPTEFPYTLGSTGFSNSDLSSPVESVIGSMDTESDEEEYLAGLTRQMAGSTLGDDFSSDKNKILFHSGSPQSTLCHLSSGCGCRNVSARGNTVSQNHASPPLTTDLLYAAAGEVARMRKTEEPYGFNNHGTVQQFAPPRNLSPVTVPSHIINHEMDYFTHQKLQAAQIQQIKQQQILKQRISAWSKQQAMANSIRGPSSEFIGNRLNNRPLGLSPSAWPPLQHAQQKPQNGSGMRAVFLGNPPGKRECAGTGVFLPRRIDALNEPRKKPGCSTVLLPARVVQALNLNLEDLDGYPLNQRRTNYNPTPDFTMKNRNNSVNYVALPLEKQNMKTQSPPTMNYEIQLPQEWTY